MSCQCLCKDLNRETLFVFFVIFTSTFWFLQY